MSVYFIIILKVSHLLSQMDSDHTKTIIHIDIDCFYAQVEMIKNPSLSNVPLGVQQKNIVVTSNYIAREQGVKKCVTISDALKACPNLCLVNGEDLHDYRQISYKITTYLQKFSPCVERLGLDENYIDVTNLVEERLKYGVPKTAGHVFGATDELCQCGCEERLKMGTVIAQEIREALRNEFNLTTCAGIAHNKLLAKLVGAKNKPNQQTVVFPNSALELMLSLSSVTKIPGIGRTTGEILQKYNIKTVEDLQNCDFIRLNSIFNTEKAKILKELSFGCDNSPVKTSGKPLSIGIEDACTPLSLEAEIKAKFQKLLQRLMVLVAEDGRIPRTLKLTIRKYDNVQKVAHKETKQCNIAPSLFTVRNSIQLTQENERKLMKTIMVLFSKLVDIRKPFHVSLLGLSFTKFQERYNGNSSITAFLKKNVEVQSFTNIENKDDSIVMDYKSTSNSDFCAEGSESEVEPSPKKSKLSNIFASSNTDYDRLSPSKLKVSELHLNSKEGCSKDFCSDVSSNSINFNGAQCPPDVDKAVFRELPLEMQQELWEDYKRRNQNLHNQIKKPKQNTLLNFLVRNS